MRVLYLISFASGIARKERVWVDKFKLEADPGVGIINPTLTYEITGETMEVVPHIVEFTLIDIRTIGEA